MRIAHCADLHATEKELDEAVKVFDYAIGRCIQEGVELMVFAGDFWDKTINVTDHSCLYPMIELVQKAASYFPIVFVCGTASHDQPGSLDVFEKLETTHQIAVSRRAEFIRVVDIGDKELWLEKTRTPKMTEQVRMLISTLPAINKSRLVAHLKDKGIQETNEAIQGLMRQLLMNFGAVNEGVSCPTVFTGHLMLSGSEVSKGQPLFGADVELSLADIRLAGADYNALGHVHNAFQPQLPPDVRYAGSMWHSDFGDVNEKGFWIVEFEGKEVQPRWIKLPSLPVVHYEVNVAGGEDPYGFKLMFQGEAKARYRYFVHPEARDSVDEEKIMVVLRAMHGDHEHKIDKRIVPVERTRSQVDKVKTLREKVTEWGKAVDREIPEGVLKKADLIEVEVGCV